MSCLPNLFKSKTRHSSPSGSSSSHSSPKYSTLRDSSPSHSLPKYPSPRDRSPRLSSPRDRSPSHSSLRDSSPSHSSLRDSSPSHTSSISIPYCINDLPNGILEHIIGFLSPYRDLKICMLVCRKWYHSVKNVIKRKKVNFNRALGNFKTQWKEIHRYDTDERYGHSTCVHRYTMFVFGGISKDGKVCDDMWALNLSNKRWIELNPIGECPYPKGYATMVHYNGNLIVFGGSADLSPFEQPVSLYNDINVYSIERNAWSLEITASRPPLDNPPQITGHTATVHKHYMIVFGGFQKYTGDSNDIWCLNLTNYDWISKVTNETKPPRRRGHSQIAINDDHLIILGGWYGESNIKLNDDIWMLNMSGNIWIWSKISIGNPEFAAPQLWCQPACKVDNLVAVVCKHPMTDKELAQKSAPVNRRTVSMFAVDFDDKLLETRESRRELFRTLEEHLRRLNGGVLPMDDLPLVPPRMALYVLDISEILQKSTVKWLPGKSVPTCGPFATILHSLVLGNSELILYGGITRNPGFPMTTRDEKLELRSGISNALFAISAPHLCI
ncbi:hypothetical protein O3M35_004827 [Rhynocoris fuscipes]|uniref:F-box domain-containing protein n=1 Tax=Rhynocoris fuscipes TaxID=488301 RepID=A0AAW1DLB2_9HEMI